MQNNLGYQYFVFEISFVWICTKLGFFVQNCVKFGVTLTKYVQNSWVLFLSNYRYYSFFREFNKNNRYKAASYCWVIILDNLTIPDKFLFDIIPESSLYYMNYCLHFN